MFFKIIPSSGRGIPTEKADQLFDRFITYKEDGTGLGLSIAARIIEAHNGTIRAFNNSDAGATFEVTLPRNSSFESGVIETEHAVGNH